MGPLRGVTVIELAGIGPGPYCAMLLADLGATVVRVDRSTPAGLSLGAPRFDLLNRGKRSLAVDLKKPAAVEAVLRLLERADVLIEGFRPGVTERLGLGPEVCLARNPKLVYGRMTGFGQSGPLASAVGHDVNYAALSGALGAIGRAGEGPTVPLNLVADFGGGAMVLALGITAALLETGRSGQGQVIDASMVEGAASLTTMFHGMLRVGAWTEERGSNLLDGGAPFYDSYRTQDGQWVTVGALEPQFFAELLRLTGVDPEQYGFQLDRERWPEQRAMLAQVFGQKTRAEWCELLEGSDVCFAPVLSFSEAPSHPHNAARGSFVTVDGVPQPGPVPRFSRTPNALPTRPPEPGDDSAAVLAEFGFSPAEIAALFEGRAVSGT